MIGAAVLVAALVFVAPVLLDGDADQGVDADVPGQRSDELRTHVFRLDEARAPPAVSTPGPPLPAVEQAEEVGNPPVGPGNAAVLAAVSAQPPAQPPPAAAKPIPPEPTAASLPPKPVAGGWVVQVGTFGQKANAERLVASLAKKGFKSFLSPMDRDGKVLYRVHVGPAGSRSDAEQLRERLVAAGQSGQLVGP